MQKEDDLFIALFVINHVSSLMELNLWLFQCISSYTIEEIIVISRGHLVANKQTIKNDLLP